MRTWSGWVLSVLGVLVAVAGVGVMVVLGPDSRLTTGPHAIETDDIAVVTAPKVIRWANVQVDVLAEVPVRKPIFVGIGNAVDVQNYLAKTQRLEITRFSRPWTLASRSVEGQPNVPGAPTALDWWIEKDDGLGGASISTQLSDETVSIAIVSVGSSNLSGLEVTLAYGVKGGFGQGIAALLLGLAMIVVGVLVRRSFWVDDDEQDDVDDEQQEEQVVYVLVDEDGVEREITAEEAAELEADEEHVLEVVEEEIVVDEPAPVQVPATEVERVVYVFVDEDGVEHEVSEDELAEFEIVDEDEEGKP